MSAKQSQQRILSFIAIMSKYRNFVIRNNLSDDTLYSTGIDYNHEMPEYLIFKRLFAVSVRLESKVSEIEMIDNDTYVCYLKDSSSYQITGIGTNQTPDFRCTINDVQLHKLSSPDFLSVVHNATDDETIAIVDPDKLGMLSLRQYCKIETIINSELGGSPAHYQSCRTIYFKLGNDPENSIIQAGVFNIEEDMPTTCVGVYGLLNSLIISAEEKKAYENLKELLQLKTSA